MVAEHVDHRRLDAKLQQIEGALEDVELLTDRLAELEMLLAAHFALDLDAAALAHGVAVSGKQAMAAKDDPARPPGAVRATAANPFDEFDADDRAFLSAACATHLRHSLGYDYAHWD